MPHSTCLSTQVLEKFEVQVSEEQAALLETLEPEWARFQGHLDEAGAKLEKYKDNFRWVQPFCERATAMTSDAER